MTYKITLSEVDVATFEWVDYRYGWADCFPYTESGEVELSENEAWRWKEAVEEDMEGGHSIFPCLDPCSDLYFKLLDLFNEII